MTFTDVAETASWWSDNAWHYVAGSSNVEAFRYDRANRYLDIQFGKGHRQYRYFNISEAMAEDFVNAPSAGEWVWQNVRGAAFERL